MKNASEKRTALHRLISYGIVQKRMVLPTELDEEEKKGTGGRSFHCCTNAGSAKNRRVVLLAVP